MNAATASLAVFLLVFSAAQAQGGDSPPCQTNADCSDGLFCTGNERCRNGICFDRADPCPFACDEVAQECGVTFDFRELGTSTGDFRAPRVGFRSCGVEVNGQPLDPAEGDITNLAGEGLGVEGGARDDLIESGEGIEFSFQGGPALDVVYLVSSARDESGNGTFGEALVEAFDEEENSLGLVAVNGASIHALSDYFGGTPIQSFQITTSADSQRIGLVSYVPSIPQALQIHGGELGGFSTPSMSLCGANLSGSDRIVTNLTFGESLDPTPGFALIRGSETLEVAFDRPQNDVLLDTSSPFPGDPDEDGIRGEALLEAFDADGMNLGTLLIEHPFGGRHLRFEELFPAPVSRFHLTALEPELVLRTITFGPEPSSAASGLGMLLALAALSGFLPNLLDS